MRFQTRFRVEPDHLLLLQVDLEHPVGRLDERPHRSRPSSKAATRAFARLAAAAGACPPWREAGYAAAKASPAPVGSIRPPTGAATTCSSRPSASTSEPRGPSVTTTSGTPSERSDSSVGSPT